MQLSLLNTASHFNGRAIRYCLAGRRCLKESCKFPRLVPADKPVRTSIPKNYKQAGAGIVHALSLKEFFSPWE